MLIERIFGVIEVGRQVWRRGEQDDFDVSRQGVGNHQAPSRRSFSA
jgi:hypothetical protein